MTNFQKFNLFSDFLNSLFEKYHPQRCYLGLIFQQGRRTMLQINVSASELGNLVQIKSISNNHPHSGKDRPEIKGHADDIHAYLVDRILNNRPWIIGTLTANIDSNLITIEELGSGLCIVVVPPNIQLDLTDGQHRKLALERLSKVSDLMKQEFIPITIVLESEFKQCQLDFKDLAQAKPVDKSLLLSFSEPVGRVGITKNLISRVAIFTDKTDLIKKAPAQNTKFIYTIQYIATLVSCALTDNPSHDLENYNVEIYSKIVSDCLNQFFSCCVDTAYMFNTKSDDLTLKQVKFFKKNSLLGVSIGLQILGHLLYCTYDYSKGKFDSDKILQLSQLDWSRNNSLWHDNVVRINSKDSTKTYISFGAAAVSDAVRKVKAYLKWM